MNSARNSTKGAESNQATWFYLILFSLAACLFTIQLEATSSSFSTKPLYELGLDTSCLEVSSTRFKTYPNPARNHVTISSEEAIEYKPRMVVFNTQGGEYEVAVKAIGNAIQLDISTIPAGRYIVKPGIGFARFIKE